MHFRAQQSKQALRGGVFPSSLAALPPLLRPSFPVRFLCAIPATLAASLLFLAGCSSLPSHSPGRTVVEPKRTVLPAQIISNFFVVESKWDDGKSYRFLIDTGSTATLVSPDLAKRFGLKPKKGPPAPRVHVRSASGGEVDLEAVTLRRMLLGEAFFERVPALVFDFTDFSDHLGVPIDGIIGFPIFRDTLLTMDYLHGQLSIAPASLPAGPPDPHASTIAFNNERNTPLIPIQMGTESFIVLIDSGSDGSLSLNPVGLHPRFANGPRIGTLISSLQGDRRQLTGRLNQNVLIGTHTIEKPVVDLTDQLSSIGGEFLRHFTVTFDQRHNQVTFARDTDGAVTMEPRRSPGLSFARGPVYWRVLTVIPDTPAAQLAVQPGDLCVRLNGEVVAAWNFERYAALLKSAAKITYTLLRGTKETDVEVPVIELVP
ncbi:MAG: hypothetical protein JWQ83_1349 [Lacunisphaera sp.]|nr:hypothetical protein [Lacunisphaera sp.]MDB6166209.1 hypothetical protein [Lacunisphaera sp.]